MIGFSQFVWAFLSVLLPVLFKNCYSYPLAQSEKKKNNVRCSLSIKRGCLYLLFLTTSLMGMLHSKGVSRSLASGDSRRSLAIK